MSPLRVLVPYLATFPGGVRTLLAAGLPELAATCPGVEITYAELCRNDADMDALERLGVRVERGVGVPGTSVLSRRTGWRKAADLSAHAPRLARIAARLARHLPAYDVCWVHGHRELLLAIAARALVRGRGPAIAWHWHGPPMSLDPGPRGSVAGRLLAGAASRRCERVIAISDFCARQTRLMGVPPSRVVTVLNAARIRDAGVGDPAEPPPERPPGAFVSLVACAAIRPHKGIHLAIEALARLPARHWLWVTGDTADPVAAPYVARLDRFARYLGVADRVRFLGARPDVHRVMSRADAVIVPSVWDEPFGLVAAEAQLLGVPLVASRRGALPEIAGDGRLGLLFDPAFPAALAAALARLEDPAVRAPLVEAARREATERYAYDRWSRDVAAALEDAVRVRTSAAPSRARVLSAPPRPPRPGSRRPRARSASRAPGCSGR